MQSIWLDFFIYRLDHLGYGNGVFFMGFLILFTRKKKHGYYFLPLFLPDLIYCHGEGVFLLQPAFSFHTSLVTVGHIYITLSQSRKRLSHLPLDSSL